MWNRRAYSRALVAAGMTVEELSVRLQQYGFSRTARTLTGYRMPSSQAAPRETALVAAIAEILGVAVEDLTESERERK